MDLKAPILLGPVQNQEHHMNGVVARRNNFNEPILGFLQDAYAEFGQLTGRHYGLVSTYKSQDADTVFVSLGCAAENIEEAVDHLRSTENAKVGSIHINVIRPFPEAAVIEALKGKKQVIILERTDEGLSADNPLARDIRTFSKAVEAHKHGGSLPPIAPDEVPLISEVPTASVAATSVLSTFWVPMNTRRVGLLATMVKRPTRVKRFSCSGWSIPTR